MHFIACEVDVFAPYKTDAGVVISRGEAFFFR